MEERKESLNCNVIGEGLDPINVKEVEEKLKTIDVNFLSVRLADSYKILITFESRDQVEKLIQKGNDSEVQEIRPWSTEEVCKFRRIWLECIRIPIHGWTLENFRRIRDSWEKFVKCDKITLAEASFMAARI